jgi:tRNA-splicing ligase RtcB
MLEDIPVTKVDGIVWEIPKTYKSGMRVPVRIYAKEELLNTMDRDVFEQASNAAMLPGLLRYSYVFSDGHSGYGVPVGWCGAFDLDEGIISPGAIGFDINCGMRLIKTNLSLEEVKPRVKELVDLLFRMVPAGVGATSYQEPKEISQIEESRFRELVENGVKWAVENGYADKKDLERLEEHGGVSTADFSKVSHEAYKRGRNQIGTLGSGNHYLEIQVIDRVYNEEIARKWGLAEFENQICVMVHCGSRGFGHQICSDYLDSFVRAMKKYNIKVPDNQLACAPFSSNEGQDYLNAMSCAINFAFVNRQLIVYQIRKAFEQVFKRSWDSLGLEIIYDVAHNTAKLENHQVNGERKKVTVHRKGATRSFGPGHPELSDLFKDTGQPVIVGGSMETGSFLCVGTKKAELETFGTTLHGSGRTMSRTKAKHMIRGEELQRKMLERGIYVKATTMSGLAEEAGFAYKNIDEVVDSMHLAGISLKVLRLRPIANIKG